MITRQKMYLGDKIYLLHVPKKKKKRNEEQEQEKQI